MLVFARLQSAKCNTMPHIVSMNRLSGTTLGLLQTQDNTHLYLLSFYYYFKKNLKNQVSQTTPSNKPTKSQCKILN